jgi:pyruvate dehydrogenase E2 component (dihydrolipoamide acetyltransferase)
MESATLTEWLKKPGEAIRRGEAVAVVETAKGLIDVESYYDGTLAQFVVAPGTKVPVGAVLAQMDCEVSEGLPLPPTMIASAAPTGSSVAPGATGPGAAAIAAAAPIATPPITATAPSIPTRRPGGRRRPISPAARHRAKELGIDLETLQQAGTEGVIHIEEVERLVAQGARAPAQVAAPASVPDPRAAMRAAIGAAMARSKREIPHYYLGQTLNFAPAREWLLRYNSQISVAERLIEGVLLIKAVAMAAASIEGFNGYFREQRFEPSRQVHVGTAVALRGGGLVAPALMDADRKDLATLMREFSDLVTRVRTGHMRSGEFAAPTITVTSLGSDGADFLYPIINPPQVAIVGSGAVNERPWVTNGQLAVKPVLELTLAGDHRVTDGRVGSRFLRAVAELLSTPEKL